jgi:hypothetical protein
LLLSPVFWTDYAPFETENQIVAWLLMVPISDREFDYIEANGIDEFDKKREEADVDILDLTRDSVV